MDERDRTQIAEVVSEKYKKAAICTESRRYELSAERRVAEDKVRARQAAAKPPGNGASSAPRPAGAASQPSAKRPTEVVTDCPTWWRICDESVKCLGPYRTTRGATKPEGFKKCHVVASAESKCGPKSH